MSSRTYGALHGCHTVRSDSFHNLLLSIRTMTCILIAVCQFELIINMNIYRNSVRLFWNNDSLILTSLDLSCVSWSNYRTYYQCLVCFKWYARYGSVVISSKPLKSSTYLKLGNTCRAFSGSLCCHGIWVALAPKYLQDFISSPKFSTTSLSPLRSLDSWDLFVPWARTTMVKSRSFTVIGPSLWNRLLPASRQLSSNLSTSPALLKTCLFSRS